MGLGFHVLFLKCMPYSCFTLSTTCSLKFLRCKARVSFPVCHEREFRRMDNATSEEKALLPLERVVLLRCKGLFSGKEKDTSRD